ncbi:MAG: TrmH family RNA methyltransferase [Burkholderiales bacterium]
MSPVLKSIVSAENPRYRQLVKLVQSSRERRKSGLSVLDGIHLAAAYREHVGVPAELFVSHAAQADPEVVRLLAQCTACAPLQLSDALFAQISTVQTPTGVMAIVPTPLVAPPPPDAAFVVLLEDIQDPGNLGSILRSAAAAGIAHVCLSPHAVHAWSPRVLRAAMGAHFMLAIHEGVDLEAYARAFQGRVVGASHTAARTIYETDLTGPVALAFGNEGSGLSAALRAGVHDVASIPMPGPVESLNVAAAAAVCLFERVRQMRVRA